MVENKNNDGKDGSKSLFRRIAAPLAFIAAICLVVICCYNSGHTGLPPTEKRYAAAKTEISALRQNESRNKQREPWEKLANEFKSIYDGDPTWPNRPAALFRSAESLEELAKRSFSRADARKAINCYETLALRHASSRLADDALFRAASMRAAWLKDDKGALALIARLKKQYPGGDMLGEAIALERALKASASGQTSPDALKLVSNSRKHVVEDTPQKTQSADKKQFADDLPLRFRAARSRMAVLRKDKIKSCWRQPWENLREEFLAINAIGKSNIAPAALYHAAACQQSLGACSRLRGDKRKAAQMFISVARRYPKSAYADDALLCAAKIQGESNMAEANATLDRILTEYPRGDMVEQARKMRAQLKGDREVASTKPAKPERPKKVAEASEVQVLSWDSINKNNVEIVLEMSAPASYSTRLVKKSNKGAASLFLELDNASVVKDIRKGVSVNGSLLQAVRVRESKKGSATLQFDFRDVRRFDARSEDDPCRIILSVAAGNAPLPAKNKTASTQVARRNGNGAKSAGMTRQVSNMASQLGLTVRRVFIDPGHGGKDPGTNHNKILERAITLDIALVLGRLLEANGLEVVYSRTRDRAVSLSERTARANTARADLFVSIHVNAHENRAVNGIETYFLDLASNSQAARVAMLENAGSDKRLADMQSMLADVMLNARADESRRLARDIQSAALFRMKKRDFAPRNNGVKSAPFHVLLGARMPAVLVEVGYCTNVREAKDLATQRYRHALAEGLAEGILAYRNRLARNRTAGNSLTEPDAGAI